MNIYKNMNIYDDEKMGQFSNQIPKKNFDWFCIINSLKDDDETDREIKKQLFFDEEKSTFMLNTISGFDLMHIIIRLNHKDDLDRSIMESLFFNEEKLKLMSKKLSGFDLMNIIIRLDSEDELDMRIKKFLFLTPEGFSFVSSIVSRSNVDDPEAKKTATIIQKHQQKVELSAKKELEAASETDYLVDQLGQNDNNPMMNDTNTSSGGSNQNEEKEKQLFDYLDKIYYKDNGVSLNSKRLYMIQVASQVLGNNDLAQKIVTDNYNFNIREVDVNKIHK